MNGIASREEAVLSGAPQGSFLGPPFFVLYINRLSSRPLRKSRIKVGPKV